MMHAIFEVEEKLPLPVVHRRKGAHRLNSFFLRRGSFVSNILKTKQGVNLSLHNDTFPFTVHCN